MLVEKLPDDISSIIFDCEQEGCFDSPEYMSARGEYGKRYLCNLDPYPECLSYALKHTGMTVQTKLWGNQGPRYPNGVLQDYDCFALLAEIHSPTLITGGRDDSAVPATLQRCQQLMPNAQLHIF